MDKFIENIKNYFKKNPKVLVAVLLLVLLIAILLVYRLADKYLDFSNTSDENYYVYVGDVKHEFNASVTTNRNGVINAFVPDKKINFDTLPIYGENKIIFPSDMIITVIDSNIREYRTKAYASINDGTLVTVDFSDKIDKYFMFDGESLYLFNTGGTLKVDNKEIELSPYSYVICSSSSVEYYDYSNDKYDTMEYKKDVTFTSNYYYVDLDDDMVGSEGNLLPTDVEHLDFISKYKSLRK